MNNSKKTFKGNRGKNKSYRERSDKRRGAMETPSTNDLSWYSKYPELLSGAAQIDYNLPQGIPISAINQTLPGFLKLTVVPGIPVTTSKSDPVNISGTNTFLYINKGKSNNRPYDPVDLTRLEIATAQIFSYVNWMQRVYGLATLYSTRNQYVPEPLITAMGVNFNNIVRNMANFRAGINQYIRKIAALVLPSEREVPYFARIAFLFNNVYIESASIKDQMYFYNPSGFFRYSTTNNNLEFERLPHREGGITYDDMLAYADRLIEDFFGDTDVATMCADIYNAYGDNIIKVSILPEDYTCIPVVDKVVLEQILNADIIQGTLNPLVIQVRGEANENPYLFYQPTFYDKRESAASAQFCKDLLERPKFLISNNDSGSPEITVENSRLMNHYSITVAENSDTIDGKIVSSGAEIVEAAMVYQLTEDKQLLEMYTYNYKYFSENRIALSDIRLLGALSQFEYAPKSSIVAQNAQGVAQFTSFVGNVKTYAVLPIQTLDNIHRACAYSLFSLPMNSIK